MDMLLLGLPETIAHLLRQVFSVEKFDAFDSQFPWIQVGIPRGNRLARRTEQHIAEVNCHLKTLGRRFPPQQLDLDSFGVGMGVGAHGKVSSE